MEKLDALDKRIGYTFQDKRLQKLALTHRSTSSNNYERLEFLGDSILGFVISKELYQRFPRAQEGQLSRLRASLVKGDTLASIARKLELGDYLRLGSGELKSGGYRRSSILADTFEALIGAVYLDSDIQQAEKFVLQFYEEKLKACDPTKAEKDPKTQLQEILQAEAAALPVYNVLKTGGEAHNQTFEVECYVEERNLKQTATGSSRRKAEQAAAKKILEIIADEQN
ncbi:MAG: ribonuclease III [Thioalkalispiraceae bacterium]|jgi:ribonuclease-3